MNYYNEHDPKAAAWLRELIAATLIPAGHVDERSITEIKPHELSKYTQCHFFAGIGGWSLALELAGWPATRPAWTGSCPCQPYSSAGQGKGDKDHRNLWPTFFALIRECRPERVFGEQVASAIGHGWLDGISADLEQEGYACGAVVLGAHSVGAPHIRQRLYWMADLLRQGSQVSLADQLGADKAAAAESCGSTLRVGDSEIKRRGQGDTVIATGFWNNHAIAHCRDGKARRFEPGSFPLAHGLPGRVGLLRGYGNAIVPQVAAEFIMAFTETDLDNRVEICIMDAPRG